MMQTLTNIDQALTGSTGLLLDEQNALQAAPRSPRRSCRKRLFRRRMRKIYGFITLLLVFLSTFATQYSSSAKANGMEEAYLASFVENQLAAPLLDEVLDEIKHDEAQATEKQMRDNALWLARCIYSESNRPDEQELIAWVVRNRVELGYRGKATYQDVVLDPYQFSAFNTDSPVRSFFLSLTPASQAPGWQMALDIARHVLDAHPDERPFGGDTWHFYSEVSMVNNRAPAWARGEEPVNIRDRDVQAERFRFYEGIM